MKILLTVIAFIFINSCIGQEIDSAWVQTGYFPALSMDTGLSIPSVNLIDEKGKARDLSEFRGKILYIDVWTTWCANCIGSFPSSKMLYKRLQYIHLDTAIQFINICTEESRADWKKLIKKYQPEGINLYATDTAFYKTWKIDAFPRYVMVDKEGKIMSLHGIDARDGFIDYILYAATKSIKPGVAIWAYLKQYKYFQKNHHYTNDSEGVDYTNWDNSIRERLAEDWKKNAEELNKNNR